MDSGIDIFISSPGDSLWPRLRTTAVIYTTRKKRFDFPGICYQQCVTGYLLGSGGSNHVMWCSKACQRNKIRKMPEAFGHLSAIFVDIQSSPLAASDLWRMGPEPMRFTQDVLARWEGWVEELDWDSWLPYYWGDKLGESNAKWSFSHNSWRYNLCTWEINALVLFLFDQQFKGAHKDEC